jgi:MFS family permease
MADIWSPQFRGIALVSYGLCVVGGPTIGPVIGSALTSSYLGWRWTSYLTGIVMMAQFTVDVLVLDETFPPALLVHKARRLRLETNDWSLHAKVSKDILIDASSYMNSSDRFLCFSTKKWMFPSRKYIKNISSGLFEYCVLRFASS